MTGFVGRRRELASMERLYRQDGFQMTVMYGRRRVGKSTLLKQFIQGKKAIYFTAVRSSAQRNLERLGQRVMEVLAPQMTNLHFPSYEEVFAFLGQQCRDERIVFIIDEFPYLAEQDPSLLSLLQSYIDSEWQAGQMYFFLCGSSVSFMEDEVLSQKSPLFGRRTSQIRLLPFDYREAAEFVPSYSCEGKAIVYGVTGGVAKYLSLFDEQQSLDANLKQLFFDTSGFLYEEPLNLLTQEFRNVSLYNAIIEAVANGRTRMSEIADLTHMESAKIAYAMNNLIATGLLRREHAITEEGNKRKTRYVLADQMFRFWYQFIAPFTDIIDFGRGDIHYEKVVKPRLAGYMGDVFEDMARYYTLLLGTEGKLDCLVTSVGKWWGSNPRKREETDIDVVGLDRVEHQAVLGECKYKNELLDKKVFDQLRERDGLINHRYRTVQFLLFSKSGFSDWVLDHQEEASILPVTLEQMYQ